MALLFQLPSPSCQEENLDVLSVLTLQLGLGDALATAGRKRLPQIAHLVLHLLSLLLFQAETHGRYLYKHSISALYHVHLHCTWKGAQKLLSKSDLLSIPRVDMGVWEGPGVTVTSERAGRDHSCRSNRQSQPGRAHTLWR